MLVEARRARRIRTMLAGRVRAEPDWDENCTIRSLSVTGARLRLRTSRSLPENFELQILRWDQSYKVRLVWHDWLDAGVEFHEPLQVPSNSDPKAPLLAQLDALALQPAPIEA